MDLERGQSYRDLEEIKEFGYVGHDEPSPDPATVLEQALARIKALEDNLAYEKEAKDIEQQRVNELQQELEAKRQREEKEKARIQKLKQDLELRKEAQREEAERVKDLEEEMERQKRVRDQHLEHLEKRIKKVERREKRRKSRSPHGRGKSPKAKTEAKAKIKIKRKAPEPKPTSDGELSATERSISESYSHPIRTRKQAQLRYVDPGALRKMEAEADSKKRKMTKQRERDLADSKSHESRRRRQERKDRDKLAREMERKKQQLKTQPKEEERILTREDVQAHMEELAMQAEVEDRQARGDEEEEEEDEYDPDELLRRERPVHKHRMYHTDLDVGNDFLALRCPMWTYLKKKPKRKHGQIINVQRKSDPNKPYYYDEHSDIVKQHETFSFLVENPLNMDRYVRMTMYTLLTWLINVGTVEMTMRDLEFYIELLAIQVRMQFKVRVERVLNSNGISLQLGSKRTFSPKALARLFKPIFVPVNESRHPVEHYTAYNVARFQPDNRIAVFSPTMVFTSNGGVRKS